MEKYLLKKIEEDGNIQFLYEFENGYGASVVRNQISYGNEQGLWEIACVEFYGDLKLCFDLIYPDEFSDVKGYLTWEEVIENLNIIKNIKHK